MTLRRPVDFTFDQTELHYIQTVARRKSVSIVNAVTFTLVIVGALNWGLVGIAQFDLVAALFGLSFGEVSPITRVIYSLVGVSAVYQALSFTNVVNSNTVVTA